MRVNMPTRPSKKHSRALGYTSHEVRDALRDVTLPDDESEALRTALQLVRRP